MKEDRIEVHRGNHFVEINGIPIRPKTRPDSSVGKEMLKLLKKHFGKKEDMSKQGKGHMG